MRFSDSERKLLLNTYMVGSKVIERIEAIGIYSFEQLAKADALILCEMVAEHYGMKCWTNKMAVQAITNAIHTAKEHRN